MRGKSKSPRSSRRKEAQTKTGKSQSLVTSFPTILKEDALAYIVRSSGFSRSAAARPPEGGTPNPLRFIDLFCGIGGFRLAFERAGGQCVFSSDWNESARITYEANHGERPHGDIHTVAVADIPAHDILCAGFPCQPFSIAGVSKKLSLGKKHGERARPRVRHDAPRIVHPGRVRRGRRTQHAGGACAPRNTANASSSSASRNGAGLSSRNSRRKAEA